MTSAFDDDVDLAWAHIHAGRVERARDVIRRLRWFAGDGPSGSVRRKVDALELALKQEDRKRQSA